MSRLRVTGKALIRALEKAGFAGVRVKGSHHRLKHPDGRVTTVPVHAGDTLGPGLLNKDFNDADLTSDELKNLLQ